MKKLGTLSKMVVSHEAPVSYQLPLGEFLIPLDKYIGKDLALEFTGEINCVACGRDIKKSYQQGYCYPCTKKLAQCDMCILKPEQCHYHLGTCREPEWGDTHCMIQHVVYLSNTSGIKVGITRGTQVPTRWIDQGAIAAIPVFAVSTRRISGLIESSLKSNISDRTNWRNMLKNIVPEIDLIAEKHKLIDQNQGLIADIIAEFGPGSAVAIHQDKVYEFEYPVLQYPEKVNSLSFDKTALVEGKLEGIKGQYLIFSHGVINMRKFGGYRVALNT
tara:strand:- start:76277 stop:77098 length:822 start_codon:yes stop_codon:yes gene_type:complete